MSTQTIRGHSNGSLIRPNSKIMFDYKDLWLTLASVSKILFHQQIFLTQQVGDYLIKTNFKHCLCNLQVYLLTYLVTKAMLDFAIGVL